MCQGGSKILQCYEIDMKQTICWDILLKIIPPILLVLLQIFYKHVTRQDNGKKTKRKHYKMGLLILTNYNSVLLFTNNSI